MKHICSIDQKTGDLSGPVEVEEELEGDFSTSSSFVMVFLRRWGKPLLWAAAALLALAIGGYIKAQRQDKLAHLDYYKAHVASDHLRKAPSSQDCAFAELSFLLGRHPAMHAKYDGLMAQFLLCQSHALPPTSYIEGALSFLPEIACSPFGGYSRTTCLIAGQNLPQAVQESLALKSSLAEKKNDERYVTLYFANLLRLASLYQELEEITSEVGVWREVEEYMAQMTAQPGSLVAMKKVFELGDVCLNDYISSRKELAAKKSI